MADELRKIEGRKSTQICACMAASLGMVSSGAVNGWSASALPSLIDDPDIYVGTSHKAWIAGIIALGAISGSLVSGKVVDGVGRRATILYTSPILALGWLIIALAPSLPIILLGRIICGFATAFMFSAIPVYNSEVPEKWLRGALGSLSTLFLTFGVVLSYVAGALTHWRVSCYICATPCILTLISMWLVPRSPYWLMLKARKDEAQASLKWLRGPQVNLKKEMSIIEEKILDVGHKVQYKELLKSRTRQPFMIALFLMTLQQSSGGNILMIYTGTIFMSAGVIQHNMATIYVGLVQILSTSISLLLVDHVGRKPMIIISTLIMGTSTTIFGVYYYYMNIKLVTWPSWIPLMTVLIAVFGYCLGCRTIPWLSASELFNTTIRSTANAVCFFYNRVLNFVIIQVYPFFAEAMGLHTVFFVYGGLCLSCCIISIFILPETKGKSLEQIQDYFQAQAIMKNQKKLEINQRKQGILKVENGEVTTEDELEKPAKNLTENSNCENTKL